ncbi:FG-GAP-like repeat-containing protein [Aquimarina sp. 2201CG5-10]|uniref:FG-GAP-like repeat-containing protein n=1 Tax=Aquimarina callyspongiae TaxID=3098150 RepID=UPI002AB4E22B|nr:FG-GAP-like repeat-containing protein [Aquimarina sp. 2201CG5-10]MDY8138833.1 FG-GAP-like repeat-containing protein [Aquimarina sp. 2201CG5-10]
MRTLLLFICFIFTITAFSQKFTLIKDTDNPIISDPPISATFFGISWTDINNDNLLDLFYAGTIYKNIGHGNFEVMPTDIPNPQATFLSSCSWGDYENDGDLDVIYSRFSAPSTLQTRIYKNDGTGHFTEANTILNTINSGTWSAQWCDFNNDSYLDFILTFADGFLNPSSFPNRLYRGNADGSFTEVTEPYEFLTTKAPYTVSNWIDYDEDGDRDLFIASGPAAGPSGIAPDFLFKNLQIENGQEGFERIPTTELSFANDPQDGQCYNAIDYDNDGDLDFCLTNFSGVENKFYVNQEGTYIETPTPFTQVNDNNLSNVWGDFDNDGDQDVLITDSGCHGSGYFVNNGDGTFTERKRNIINLDSRANSTGITVGDYDNDGDLDFFAVGANSKALFRNDLRIKRRFVNIKLIGNPSNKAALGARLELTARINGQEVTQKREISASNSFMGHNSLRAHFGLGRAPRISKLKIYWPSGNVDTFSNLRVNKFYTIEEGKPISLPIKKSDEKLDFNIALFPNPTENSVTLGLDKTEINTPIIINLADAAGRIISKKTYDIQEEIVLDTTSLSPGNYFINISINEQRFVEKLVIK